MVSRKTRTLPGDILERAAALKRAEIPFVLATVVWSHRPTSAKPGAKGIITQDGALFGWVGGTCAQPAVIREALRALEDGQSRILRLSPESGGTAGRPNVVVSAITCQSGGTLEVFLEPFRPPLQLLVVGESPVSDALIRFGHLMGYRVIAARPGATETVPAEADLVLDTLEFGAILAGRRTVAVVASMSIYDEDGVERALQAGAEYVALVASRRRFEAVLRLLRSGGLHQELLSRLKAPAGLDIGASTPEEVAVSILAEIISRRRSAPSPGDGLSDWSEPAIDPVCGMEVDVSSALHTVDYQGTRYYFCAASCRRSFEANAAEYCGAR